MKCPNCNNNLVNIIYGMPSSELMEKVKNKEVCLGGCNIIYGVEQPKYHCFKCGKSFDKGLREDSGEHKLNLEKRKIEK